MKAVASRLYADVMKMSLADAESLEFFVQKIVKTPSAMFVTAYAPATKPVGVKVGFVRSDGSAIVGRVPDLSGIVVIEPRQEVRVRRAFSWPKKARTAKQTPISDSVDTARAGYASLRAELVDKSVSLRKAAARMHLSPQGLSDRIERGQILAFPDGNRKMIPVELIDLEQPDRTVPGLAEVIRSASVAPFRLAVWLSSESRALGGNRPVDELRRGNVARVVKAARALDVS